MEPKDAPSDAWVPEAEREVLAVRDQLYRILASPLFSHSKRYPRFLRYVVEKTLEGRSDELKERTLGVEVFDRDPDYDTSLDAIVRITAGEIRKRIAQYYHEQGHGHEIRIDLPLGSYVPEFRPAVEKSAPHLFIPAAEKSPDLPVVNSARITSKWPWIVAGVAVCVAILGTFLWFHSITSKPALDQLWQPVLSSSNPVLICIGEQNKSVPHNLGPDPTVNEYLLEMDHILIPDGIAMSRLTNLIQGKGRSYAIQSGSATTFTDLQQGPVVLIGGFNNEWTIRLTGHLRYIFSKVPNSAISSIVDSQNPHNRWDVDFNTPLSKLPADYAIVARFQSSETDRMIVVAAGISAQGTIAAGEFLTTPAYLNSFVAQAPKGWAHKNMEAVLRTEMINGKSGPPRVVAAYFW